MTLPIGFKAKVDAPHVRDDFQNFQRDIGYEKHISVVSVIFSFDVIRIAGLIGVCRTPV